MRKCDSGKRDCDWRKIDKANRALVAGRALPIGGQSQSCTEGKVVPARLSLVLDR